MRPSSWAAIASGVYTSAGLAQHGKTERGKRSVADAMNAPDSDAPHVKWCAEHHLVAREAAHDLDNLHEELAMEKQLGDARR